MDILLLLVGVFLHFFATPLLIIALIWFFFVVRRLYREKKSLDAFKGNEVAKAMTGDRLKANFISALGIFLFPVLLAGLMYLLVNALGEDALGAAFNVALLVAVAVTLFCWRWSSSLEKRYSVSFKEAVVRPELAKAFANPHYEPDKAFDPEFIRDLQFFKDFEGCSGNDLIAAEYRGVHFTQFDMEVKERQTVDEALRGAFKGRVMRFDFADPFRGKVQVLSKSFVGAAVTGSRGGWQGVETELADFGKYYEVYAIDPLDAMAVLTPQMIEGIFYLKKALDVPAAFYFTGNTMTVFLALGRDAFDVSGKRTLLEESELLRHDIASVTGFMDVMYFKRQAAAEEVRPAAEVNRSEVAASVAESVELSGMVGTTLRVERGRGMLLRGLVLLWKYLPMLIIAAYLVGTMYAFIDHQDEFTWGFPLLGGGIIAFSLLSGRNLVSLGILALYLLFI